MSRGHPKTCQCRGCWIDCGGCFNWNDESGNPYTPPIRSCPFGHREDKPDLLCEACRQGISKPSVKDLWEGKPVKEWWIERSKLTNSAVNCINRCPGTELKRLLSVFGITPDNCQCNSRAAQMDRWGVEGCKQHRDEIINWLREESKKLNWWQKISAGVAALKAGVILKFHPLDPAPGLVDEAIRRAEIREDKPTSRAKVDPPWEEDTVSQTNYSSGRKLYRWSYGITTCPKRRGDLLPRTLASLKAAGFDKPHLFVDNDSDSQSWINEFGLNVTTRFPRANPYSNWLLSLYELVLRDKDADRFAIFQDDLICVKGLREYLDHCEMAPKTYWNLYTFPKNLRLCPRGPDRKPLAGWHPTDQGGRGALGLVFSREGVVDLLSHPHMLKRLYGEKSKHRWWRFIDGAVVDSLTQIGYTELCHNPSLLQHTGITSSIDHSRTGDGRNENFTEYKWHPVTLANSFQGENWDVMTLVKSGKV